MPGTVIPVADGRAPTQLSGAPFVGGTTIYNLSESYEIWVANNQSVSVGNGYRIGPLGSLTWRGGIPWAIIGVDTVTGDTATSPVSVTISDDVQDPVNPVDVAIATARAGIPVINKLVPVWDEPMILPKGSSVTPSLDVRQYSSAILEVTTPIPRQGVAVKIDQSVKLGSNDHVITGREFRSSDLSSESLSFAYQFPLVADSLTISNTSVSTPCDISLIAYVSTRQLPEKFLRAGSGNYKTNNGETVIETIAPIAILPPNTPIAFGASFYSNGGPSTIRATMSGGAGDSLYLGYRFASNIIPNNNYWPLPRVSMSGGGEITFDTVMPFGLVQFIASTPAPVNVSGTAPISIRLFISQRD